MEYLEYLASLIPTYDLSEEDWKEIIRAMNGEFENEEDDYRWSGRF